MSRTTGAFYVMGGVLGLVVTAIAPANDVTDYDQGNRLLVAGAAAAAVLLGVSLLGWGPRMPHGLHHGYVVAATILVTVAVHSFPNTICAITLASFYAFIACDAALFFGAAKVAGHLAFAVALCLWVLPSRGGLPWWSGLIPAGVTIGVGLVVAILTRMASEAEVDALTGLSNRRGFDRAVNKAIENATRSGQGIALVLVDLDRFQKVNDHLGHRAGDAVLQQIADTWRAMLEPGQVFARYGGDVFALLLPGTTEQAAILLTERLRSSVRTGCSAGVTSWQIGESGSLLISRADVGLYRAKQAGRNRTVLESSCQLPLAVELREAIDRGALDVHYQPIVSLDDGGEAVGVEALLRWSSNAQPDVTTEGLIRVAEEYDLIGDLDELVLRRACADAAQLQDTFAQLELTLNVNVSGLELAEPGYAERVTEILSSTGWSAEQLVLEVTESELAAESDTAIANLHTLRDQGVRIAIDDFGTGYSSLSRLATLPSDIIKVDQSFVAAIRSDSPAPPLLGVIAALSKSLDLEMIAEGVETEHQAAVLTELGFTLAQGFHYSDSHPVDALIRDLNQKQGQQPAAVPGNGTVAEAGRWVPLD